MKCQYTGIAFSETSKRQKNHPRVTEFLNEANKDARRYAGAYQAAKDILNEVKSAAIDEIDEAMEYANSAYSAWKSGEAKPIIRRTQGDIMREKKAASRTRDAQNKILSDHGYRWEKEEYGTEDEFLPGSYGAGIGEYAGYRWTLYGPDGKRSTVQAAFKAIGVELPS